MVSTAASFDAQHHGKYVNTRMIALPLLRSCLSSFRLLLSFVSCVAAGHRATPSAILQTSPAYKHKELVLVRRHTRMSAHVSLSPVCWTAMVTFVRPPINAMHCPLLLDPSLFSACQPSIRVFPTRQHSCPSAWLPRIPRQSPCPCSLTAAASCLHGVCLLCPVAVLTQVRSSGML